MNIRNSAMRTLHNTHHTKDRVNTLICIVQNRQCINEFSFNVQNRPEIASSSLKKRADEVSAYLQNNY